MSFITSSFIILLFLLRTIIFLFLDTLKTFIIFIVSNFMKISSSNKELIKGNSFFSNSSILLSSISPLFFTSISIIEFKTGFWFHRYDSIKNHLIYFFSIKINNFEKENLFYILKNIFFLINLFKIIQTNVLLLFFLFFFFLASDQILRTILLFQE